MNEPWPLQYRYDRAWTSSEVDGELTIELGRRTHLFWSLPIMLPFLLAASALGFRVFGQLIDTAKDLQLRDLLAFVLVAGLVSFIVAGVWLLTVWMIFSLVQDAFGRRLVIDKASGNAYIQSMPGSKRRFHVQDVESIHFLSLIWKGRRWGYVCVQIRGRRSLLRLIEIISKPRADLEAYREAVRPIIERISNALEARVVEDHRASVWRLLWIWSL